MYRSITSSLRFVLAGILLCFAANSAGAQGYDDTYGGNNQASYQQFYDELTPYGQWVDDPQYGYVWVPDAGNDFRPYYSNGYWVNSDYGNTWVSNYSWGWAPFHYGRWTYSSYYGWLWVPGNEWGPAWVSWRSGGGSYGWAPLGPGISVSVGLGNSYYVPDYWWNFTPQQYILNPGVHNYCYGPRYNPQYLHQTTIINNTYVHNHNTYITGPRRQELAHAIGRPVPQVAINNSRRPDRTQLQGNNLSIYRPAIAQSHPRATERPRSFSPAREPVADAAHSPRESGFNRAAVRQPSGGGRSGTIQQQAPAQQQQTAQPARNAWSNRPPEQRQERPRLDPVMQVPQQQQQPVQQAPRDWNNNNINRAPQPVQQQPQAPRQERPVFNRPAEMSRQQDVQRPQPRMERPQPAAQPQPVQRAEQPRMEAPRQAPSERLGSGEGGHRR